MSLLSFFKSLSNTHSSSDPAQTKRKSDHVKDGGKPGQQTRRRQESARGRYAPNKSGARRQSGASKSKGKPAKSTWNISQFSVPVVPGKKRFHDFDLPDALMHGIHDLGYKYCTPIQAEILSHTLKGSDALGKAQTGTGKTAAFLITAIKLLLEIPPPTPRYLGEPRVVIIAPTRELALQIGKDAKALSRYTRLNTVMLVGGIDYDKQKAQLARNLVDILIATPGRLLDFISQREVYLDLTETLVLDEADRMLDMGFIPQVRRIVSATPRRGDRQTLFFSATFSDDVIRLAKQWTWNPVEVDIAPEAAVTDTIDQKIYMVGTEEKYTVLRHLIQRRQLKRVILFANRRHETRKLCERLKKDGINADYISGDVPQKKRLNVLDGFKTGKINVLVATDVAGRGIHIEGISHVINYNLPEEPEDYIHRIGRTGRAGTQGISISFACEEDAFLIEDLEKRLGEKLVLSYPPEDLT